VPKLVFVDRDNLILAMTAAPDGAVRWKDQLLAGDISEESAARAGKILGGIIAATHNHPGGFDDLTVFDQLRLDPYYRSTAARVPDLRDFFDRRIADCQTRRVSLVHGDYSPKNFLSSPGALLAIDFECIHWGDPAFDSGFLINHLLMKSILHPERRDGYRAAAIAFFTEANAFDWFERATIEHLGCLLLARVDGKSPAEYLRTPELQDRTRSIARQILLDPPSSIGACFDHV
jgi:Ser/Thr protein kinase RdoA (MazF antagonist)